jgi:uncharacterized Zn-binding protein involved in type VI secretion
MANEKATFRDGELVITNLSPDVCLTPLGRNVVPVPYPISHTMAAAKQCSPNVFINGRPAFLHNESFADGAKGDEPGVKGGVVTGVVGRVSHSIQHSASVLVNGKQLVRTGDRVWMNQKPPR